jgi:hypothetical protein
MSKATDKARAAVAADMDRWRADSEARADERWDIVRRSLPMLRQLAPEFVQERHLDDGKDAATWTLLEASGVMIDTDELMAIVALAAAQFELPR